MTHPPAPSGGPADLAGLRVFISYPRGGAAEACAVEAEAGLRERGARVFLDQTRIPEGDANAITRIEDELSAADVLAFFAGADTAASVWQQREAALAEFQRIPVVLVMTHTGRPPFYLSEKQPVTAHGRAATAWLPRLEAALAHAVAAQRADAAGPAGAPGAAGASPQRRAELAYLAHQLAVELWDRADRYTAIAAEERPSQDPLKTRHDLPFSVDLMMELFADAPGAPGAAREREPRRYADVLAAYRDLLARRGPGAARLVVLGEPGAGKSFSLDRLFCTLADAARADASAPVPLRVALGDWTRASQPFEDLLALKLRPQGLDAHLHALREQGRALLLLDGLNEIPVGQRAAKAEALFTLAQDRRWAGVVLSCRARDYEHRPLHLPFDTLTLQPLAPPQVLDFLHRWALRDHAEPQARERAEARFWQLAAGPERAEAAAGVWAAWQRADAPAPSWEDFWQVDDVQRDAATAYKKTTSQQDTLWHEMRHGPRTLLRLASSPYWLTLLAMLPELPASKPRLVEGFLRMAHDNGAKRCHQRAALNEVPPFEPWRRALGELALALQGLGAAAGADDGAQTRLPRAQCPAALDDTGIEFAIGVQVLRQTEGQLHFTHQLMQEALAAVGLIDQVASPQRPAAHSLWPRAHWWQRNGWEVVAEFAAEGLARQPAAALQLVAWLAEAQPEVAARAWLAAGSPALPGALRNNLARDWADHLTDIETWPQPAARAAIGRALAAFDLDHRPGIGLRADGLPDIDWVVFDDGLPFVYQGRQHAGLPGFAIARMPVTHRQYQAFIADGGYREDRWWAGLARRFDGAMDAAWPESNAPRERVSWFEAVAFCRWLSARLGHAVALPTEQQWERVAAGRKGWAYPASAKDYVAGQANVNEPSGDVADGVYLERTTAVGLYPQGASKEGSVLDLAGNVWEWCLNEYEKPENIGEAGDVLRVLRGGSWDGGPSYARASSRLRDGPGNRGDVVGFRVCRASPIGPLTSGAAGR